MYDDSFLQTGRPIRPGFLVGPDKGGRAGDVGHAQDEELPVEAEVGQIEVGARSGNRLDKLQEAESRGSLVFVNVTK